MNRTLVRSAADAAAATGSGFFSAGKDSPVIAAWLTSRSRALSATPSAGKPAACARRMIPRWTERMAVAIGCGSWAALIAAIRAARSGKSSAKASATIPPYEEPTIASTRAIPRWSSTAARSRAWSRVPTGPSARQA